MRKSDFWGAERPWGFDLVRQRRLFQLPATPGFYQPGFLPEGVPSGFIP